MKHAASSAGHRLPFPLIPCSAFLIAVCGLLTIASAQSGSDAPFFLAAKQLAFLLAGLFVMAAAAQLPFAVHAKLLLPVYVTLSILSLLLLPLFGVRVNGMQGWYSVAGFFIQPSELSKGVFLLLLAVLAARQHVSELRRFLILTGVALLWTVPILLQPDFGTAAVYLAGFGVIYFLAGGNWKALAVLALLMLGAAVLFVLSKSYALARLTAFLNPEGDLAGAGWHIRQFQMAIAHGGYFGAKLGQAVWSNAYLPLAYNDSAFATMGETLGLAGTSAVLVLFILLIGALFKLPCHPQSSEAAHLYPAMAAILLAIQTLLHLSVNVGLLPPTGLTLPLVSYGGSSLLGTFFMLGLAISAKRDH